MEIISDIVHYVESEGGYWQFKSEKHNHYLTYSKIINNKTWVCNHCNKIFIQIFFIFFFCFFLSCL